MHKMGKTGKDKEQKEKLEVIFEFIEDKEFDFLEFQKASK